jgi:hypothetical protein
VVDPSTSSSLRFSASCWKPWAFISCFSGCRSHIRFSLVFLRFPEVLTFLGSTSRCCLWLSFLPCSGRLPL